MNIDAINLILDDNRSYFDAPKDLFIETLNKQFEYQKFQGVSQFEKVEKGICQKCFVGCFGYSFLTKNNDYLDIIIEEEEGRIIDLTQCTKFKNDVEVLKNKQIYLYFKKDLRTSYLPSTMHLAQQTGIDKAEDEFKGFENKIITLKDLEFWNEKWATLFDSVKYMNLDHYFVCSFVSTYYNVKSVLLLRDEKEFCKLAMLEFNSLNTANEKEIINWLIEFKENKLLFETGFELTKNWKKTHLLTYKNSEDFINEGLKFYENIIIDVEDYLDSVEFSQVYTKYYFRFEKEVELIQITP